MGYIPGITVVIPTIPVRSAMFSRALDSVACAIGRLRPGVLAHVRAELDLKREGAAATRHRGLMSVDTEWVAFLDDDDTMDPGHLNALYEAAQEHGADYLWSRFRIGLPGGRTQDGPAPLGAGTFEQWNDAQPAQTTVTTMVRTELAKDIGGFFAKPGPDDVAFPVKTNITIGGLVTAIVEQAATGQVDGQRAGEDWRFTLACRAAGGVFRHVPEVTWTWNHHGANTSGLPDRW